MTRMRARLPLVMAAACFVALGVSVVVYSAGNTPPSASGTGQGTDTSSGNTILLTFGAADHTTPPSGTEYTGIAKQREYMGMITTTTTIDIDCLIVTPAQNGYPARAYMSGPAQINGVPTACPMKFAVEDNGEGGKATGPDKFTRFTPGKCTDYQSDPDIPSDRGNIQVRGATPPQ